MLFFFRNLFMLFIFIFGCTGFPLPCVGFSLVVASRGSRCMASHRGGFSCCGARAVGSRASVVVAHRLQ